DLGVAIRGFKDSMREGEEEEEAQKRTGADQSGEEEPEPLEHQGEQPPEPERSRTGTAAREAAEQGDRNA
ncbi:MAG: hypothetical protein ACOC1T_03565, partial [Halorhodospira sp.]